MTSRGLALGPEKRAWIDGPAVSELRACHLLLFQHLPNHGPLAEPNAGLVYIDDFLPILQGHVGRRAGNSPNARTVDGDINPAELIRSFADCRVDGLLVGHIDEDDQNFQLGIFAFQLIPRAVQCSGIDVHKGQAADAMLGERVRGALPDP